MQLKLWNVLVKYKSFHSSLWKGRKELDAMLKKILSRTTCAACQLCCQFDASDIWELPVLPAETVAAIQKYRPETAFVPVGAEQTFAAPPLKGEELYACPVLTEHGCGLSEQDKPFDCKVWPFRLMRTANGTVCISISDLCTGVQLHEVEQLQAFLREGLAETMFTYAKAHPDHIHAWHDGYRVILTEPK